MRKIQIPTKVYNETFLKIKKGEVVAQKCDTCLEEKPATQFYIHKGYSRRECKACSCKRVGVINVGQKERNKELWMSGRRNCYKCGREKDLNSDFYNNKMDPFGKTSICKTCAYKEVTEKRKKKKLLTTQP